MMKFDAKAMAKAMQRMGMQQQEVDAVEVIVRCEDKDIIIANPQVSKVNMMGQETWQVIGNAVERSRSSEPDIKDEDVQTVAEQAGKSREEAEQAIKAAKGDLAQAILNLSES
ncbi:nascent polypeptide-associated complex protein [Candidatus Woesearchaeota archaeon CG10_big_fil_rev_8_21_14_0_10_37_12]|nr:MAG: nascent polypeptide-associated complex protein [Candidatus Woesearchaeota archaeon CG10_big_fil_rev_8_21_14_0_10_37_12]